MTSTTNINTQYYLDNASPAIRYLTKNNPYCMLGISTRSSRQDVLNLIESLKTESEENRDIQESSEETASDASRQEQLLSDIQNTISELDKIEPRLLWFSDNKILSDWSSDKSISVSSQHVDYNHFLACFYYGMVKDAAYHNYDLWKSIFQLIDNVLFFDDEHLVSFVSAQIPADIADTISDQEIIENYHNAILNILKININEQDVEALIRLLEILLPMQNSFKDIMWDDILYATIERLETWVSDMLNQISAITTQIEKRSLYSIEYDFSRRELITILSDIEEKGNISFILKIINHLRYIDNQFSSNAETKSRKVIKSATATFTYYKQFTQMAKFLSYQYASFTSAEKYEVIAQGKKIKEPYLEYLHIPEDELSADDCYHEGDKWDEVDADKYYKWMKLAAEKGDAGGMNNVGYCYATGYGIDKNMESAVFWYRKAAELGDADGYYNLGLKYYNGNVPAEPGIDAKEEAKSCWIKSYITDPDSGAGTMLIKYFPNWKKERIELLELPPYSNNLGLLDRLYDKYEVKYASYVKGLYYYNDAMNATDDTIVSALKNAEKYLSRAVNDGFTVAYKYLKDVQQKLEERKPPAKVETQSSSKSFEEYLAELVRQKKLLAELRQQEKEINRKYSSPADDEDDEDEEYEEDSEYTYYRKYTASDLHCPNSFYYLNDEQNGIEIYFDYKPKRDIRDYLVANRWRWNPRKLCWYIPYTNSRLDQAKMITGNTRKRYI